MPRPRESKFNRIMAIKVKAIERNVSFEKGQNKWAYVLQAELYSKLSEAKVIQEAALRSGISKGAINAAWEAIGEVIRTWATEGHSVAVPGLGSMRFGLRSESVSDVNKVGANLITSRRVIFTPSIAIKKELAETSVSITCYDRNGEIVKRITSSDDAEIEDPDNEDQQTPETVAKYTVTAVAADSAMGSVTGGGEYEQGTEVTLKATAKNGYVFSKWSDGNTSSTRKVVVSENATYTAQFEAQSSTPPSI